MARLKKLSIIVSLMLVFSMFTNINVKKASAQENVNVDEQEPNDQNENAQKISGKTTVTGMLQQDDTDEYSFEVSKDSSDKVKIDFQADTEGVEYNIVDGNGKEVDQEYLYLDNSEKGMKQSFDYILDPGKYYIVLKQSYTDYQGKYTLHFEQSKIGNKDVTSNNSYVNALNVGLNSEFTGVVSTNDEKNNHDDIYKFTVPKAGKVVTTIKDPYNYGYAVLYDSNCNQLNNVDTKVSSVSMSNYLDAGTYYLKIPAYTEPRIYKVKIAFTDLYSNETANDTLDHAQSINLDQNYIGVITDKTSDYDIDCYKFYIPKKETVYLNCSLFGYMDFVIYNGLPKTNESNNIDWLLPSSACSYMNKKYTLNKGTYYIKAYGITNSGSYKFSITTQEMKYRYNLETPKNNASISGKTAIKGWYLYAKPINKIDVLIDGKYYGVASRSARNDLKNSYKAYDVSKAGFNYTLDTTKLSNGKHKIQLKATGSDGKVNWSAVRNVSVSNKPLAYKSNIETPKYNSSNKGKTVIKGWYTYGKQISRLDVYVDGKKIGQVSKRSSRYDLAKWYKAYDLSKAGFTYTVDFSKYKKGSHKIMIKAIGADGTSNCSYRTIKTV